MKGHKQQEQDIPRQVKTREKEKKLLDVIVLFLVQYCSLFVFFFKKQSCRSQHVFFFLLRRYIINVLTIMNEWRKTVAIRVSDDKGHNQLPTFIVYGQRAHTR